MSDSVFKPTSAVTAALLLATVAILTTATVLIFAMADSYDRLSLQYFNDQLSKPLKAEISEKRQLFELDLELVGNALAKQTDLIKASTDYLIDSNSSNDSPDSIDSLVVLKKISKQYLTTFQKIANDDHQLDVIALSYIPKTDNAAILFTETISSTTEKFANVSFISVPPQMIQTITERKRADRFLTPIFYWVQAEGPYAGLPFATITLPLGRFDFSGYALLHVSALSFLKNLDHRFDVDLDFFPLNEGSSLDLGDVRLKNNSEVSVFQLNFLGPLGRTFPHSPSIINDGVKEKLAKQNKSSEISLGQIQARADISKLKIELSSVRNNSLGLFVFIDVLVVILFDGLVILLVVRLFRKQIRAEEELKSSIKYTADLQQKLLPSMSIPDLDVEVLWKPRDEVSGDIYIIEYQENRTILGVVDCTGHGVPGAFLSGIVAILLDRVFSENALQNPGEILSRVNQIFRERLNSAGRGLTALNDGFEASLCIIDKSQNTVTFASAGLSLFILDRRGYCTEVKGDKNGVGGRTTSSHQFKTFDISNHEGLFIMFSDGVTDVSNTSKKPRLFGKKRLRNFLSMHSSLPIKDLIKQLKLELDGYGGESGQRDDITVLAFEVKKRI